MKKISVTTLSLFLLSVVQVHAQSGTFNNPTKISSIADLVQIAIRLIVVVMLPVVSLAFVYAGFLFITAQGSKEKVAKARQNLLAVVIGAILTLGVGAILTILVKTASQIMS